MKFLKFALLGLVACTISCDSPSSEKAQTQGERLSKKGQALLDISGHWESRKGVLEGLDDKYISVDISMNGNIVFEVRKMGRKLPIVSDRVKTSYSKDSDYKRFSGTIDSPPERLSIIEEFSFMGPEEGKIRIIGKGGSFDVFYKGQ